ESPASVLKIDEYTFQYCTNLQSAVMGEGIVSIGYGAFEYCENLESINLPQDLVSVDRYAFDGCNALKYVFFKGTKEQWEGMIIKEDNDPLKNAAAHFNAIGHAYKETVVPPTCTEQGYTVYTCTCGDTYKDKFTNVAGHNYSKTFTIDKQATMKANGSKSRHCTACDATTDKKTIYKASTVKLSTTKYVYNGKTKSPSIVIKDSKGNTISNANYKVTKPSGRKNVGKYTYKITFKNEYSRSKSLYLTINPKAPTIKTPAAAKKAMTVKWSKVSSQATGYEIMYATNSKFTKGKKTVKVTSYKTTSKKISKLTSKKIYYVKIRTYKTVKGVKYYSAWSKVKSVKVK
ncbi:MAG: leucine-rich repeat protein, partial [Firmicutes bacterium]|nr:leucine-rich repeat protein [Bacillota bacterium]